MAITISGMRESTFGELISNYAPDELQNPLFIDLRVFIDDICNLWFIGSEVASIMGYSDTDQAIRYNVPEEYRLTRTVYGSGQGRTMTIISEMGFYALAMRSKLPSARQFQDWVYRVISRIRQYGGYISPNSNLLQVVDIIPEQYRQSITNMIDIKNRVIDEQNQIINRQKSSLEFRNSCINLNTAIIRDQNNKLNYLSDLIYAIVGNHK